MKTEEIQRRTSGRSPNEVSPAVQDLTPEWSLVDRRGRPVGLTAAGYVLRSGQAYHLRLISPFKREEIDKIRIVNPPAFVRVEADSARFEKEDDLGRAVYDLPFMVNLDTWANLRKLGVTLTGDDLEIVHEFKPNVCREAPPFCCPVVVRPRWALVLFGVISGLLLLLVEKLLTGLFHPTRPPQDALEDLLDGLGRPQFWLLFVSLAFAVWLAVNMINLVLLYRRARELRHSFYSEYLAIDELDEAD